MRLYGTAATMTLADGAVRLHHPDGTLETFRGEGMDGGYYNEFLNFHEALTGKASLVGTAAQSYRNMELILRGLASARTGETVAVGSWPDPLRPQSVPLWRPAGAPASIDALFAGLPVALRRQSEVKLG